MSISFCFLRYLFRFYPQLSIYRCCLLITSHAAWKAIAYPLPNSLSLQNEELVSGKYVYQTRTSRNVSIKLKRFVSTIFQVHDLNVHKHTRVVVVPNNTSWNCVTMVTNTQRNKLFSSQFACVPWQRTV